MSDSTIEGLPDLAQSATASLDRDNDLLAVWDSSASTTKKVSVSDISAAISVKDYGAVGDGVADDTAAIQAAIDALRASLSNPGEPFYEYELVFPPGIYKVTSTIDATGIRGFSWVVSMRGAAIYAEVSGAAVIDAMDTRNGNWDCLSIWGDATTVATVGMQIGLRTDKRVASENTFYRPEIIGTFSTCCFFNYSSEICAYYSPRFWNKHTGSSSYALIMDGTNESGWGITSSAGVTADVGSSFNENVFFNGDFRKQNNGPCVFIARASRHRYYGCYGVSKDDAVWVVKTTSGNNTSDLYLDQHSESSPTTSVRFDGAATHTINGFTYVEHSNQATSEVFKAGTSVTSVTIKNADIRILAFANTPTSGIFNLKTYFSVYGSVRTAGDSGDLKNLANFNGNILVEDYTACSYGPGTQFIQDYTDTSAHIKGTVNFYSDQGSLIAGTGLADTARVRITGGTIDLGTPSATASVDFYDKISDTYCRGRILSQTNGDLALHAGGVPPAVSDVVAGLKLTASDVDLLLDLDITNGKNLVLGTSTGTKIGTSTSQKLGFYNASPDIQPTTGITGASFTANSGTAINDASTFDGYTIGKIVAALRQLGLLA